MTIQFRMRGPGQDASDLAHGDVVAPTIIKTHGAALAAAELYLASPGASTRAVVCALPLAVGHVGV